MFLLSLLTLTACASCTTQNDEEPVAKNTNNENQQENPEEEESKNVLVVYFSCTNTTRKIVEDISEITGGKLFRSEPTVAYTSADLDYNTGFRLCSHRI